ncbi:alpha/beta hydrolase family protein [Mycobacterium kansasii]|uniref:Alpha/beta hydrolase family protein n=1 Tax=Mycobacterium kansasii TaxID=1768 RepID=A0A1V3X226_MYCKA|nr:alpha/beta hydrolase family protein [Mycobacterium kansasii]
MDRIDVTFPSNDAKCAAWLYYPTGIDNKVPCVVMAHGFSLTRHDGLTPYAEAFARVGAAVLVFDHRFIGDSEGQPRQRIRPADQLADRRAAVAFARNLGRINPDRIIVWGYSMSAGSALLAAATDPRIAGAILLCPLLDGRWRSNRSLWTQPRNAAWINAQAINDTLGNAMVPVAAQPGGHGVLTFPANSTAFSPSPHRDLLGATRSGVRRCPATRSIARWLTRENSNARSSSRPDIATSPFHQGPSTSSHNGPPTPW